MVHQVDEGNNTDAPLVLADLPPGCPILPPVVVVPS